MGVVGGAFGVVLGGIGTPVGTGCALGVGETVAVWRRGRGRFRSKLGRHRERSTSVRRPSSRWDGRARTPSISPACSTPRTARSISARVIGSPQSVLRLATHLSNGSWRSLPSGGCSPPPSQVRAPSSGGRGGPGQPLPTDEALTALLTARARRRRRGTGDRRCTRRAPGARRRSARRRTPRTRA